MTKQTFRAAGYPWRLYCGAGVIEAHLGEALDRVGAKRAFIVCSPSVHKHTNLVVRVTQSLGERCAGYFDGIEKDSNYASVVAAKAAATAAGADLLIGLGGGSVIVANRAVAIFMGESADPFEIMTQYPEGRPAFSPRLLAPKLPIINIPTTPTSAMNRAGTGLKNADLDHRMEYFDPKTRPSAVFLDDDALLTSPPGLLCSTATTVFAGLVGTMSQIAEANPLVEADHRQAFRLASDAYRCLAAVSRTAGPRRALALAAFLQNRAEDDGGRVVRRGAYSGNYAVSTALHLRHPHVGQGESISAIHTTRMRLEDAPDPQGTRDLAEALGIGVSNMTIDTLRNAIADHIDAIYAQVGMPTRLRALDIPRDDLEHIARQTVKNFNANAGVRSAAQQENEALRLLQAAW